MFIPNKTYHVIKASVLALIVVLLLVISAESVLYLRMLENNKKEIAILTYQIDSLTHKTNVFEISTVNKHNETVTSIAEISMQLSNNANSIKAANDQINTNNRMIDILVSNACKIQPYYMDKRLMEFCRQ